jgi:bifunctional DNase/RNase
LDSRTSDAVAIALLAKVPIYIRKETLESLMVFRKNQTKNMDNVQESAPMSTQSPESDNLEAFVDSNLKDMTLNDLQDLLEGAIASEEFELANKIHEEIQKRKGE